jgi:hypothetical protein
MTRHNTWAARVKRDATSVFLGNFPTREEAVAAEQAYAEIYPAKRKVVTPSKVRKPYMARRYRNGVQFNLGSYYTIEEARAVEAAFDAENPRQKPGPNSNPKRPARSRKGNHR